MGQRRIDMSLLAFKLELVKELDFNGLVDELDERQQLTPANQKHGVFVMSSPQIWAVGLPRFYEGFFFCLFPQ